MSRALLLIGLLVALRSAAAFRGPDYVDVSAAHLDTLLAHREEPQVVHDQVGQPVVVLLGKEPRISTTPLPDGTGTRVCLAPAALASDWAGAETTRGDAVSNGDGLAEAALRHVPHSVPAEDEHDASRLSQLLADLDASASYGHVAAKLRHLGFARPNSVRGVTIAGPTERDAMAAVEAEWGKASEGCGKQAIKGDNGYYELCAGRHFRWFIDRNASDHTGGTVDALDEQTVFGRHHPDLSRPVVAGDALLSTYPDGDPCPADPRLPNLRYETTVAFRCLDDAPASATQQRRWEVQEMAGHCRAAVSIYTAAICTFFRAGGSTHDVPVIPCANIHHNAAAANDPPG